MAKSVYYDFWLDIIRKMNEQELLQIINNGEKRDKDYIRLVKNRLILDYNHSEEELDDAISLAEAKYQGAKVEAETDKSLSTAAKVLIFFSYLFCPGGAIAIVLFMSFLKVKNSLGERRYLYDEAARKWLLYSIVGWSCIYALFILILSLL